MGKCVSFVQDTQGDWYTTEAQSVLDTDGDASTLSPMDLLVLGKFCTVDVIVPAGQVVKILPGIIDMDAAGNLALLLEEEWGEIYDLAGVITPEIRQASREARGAAVADSVS